MAVLVRLPRLREVTTLVVPNTDNIQQPTKSPDYPLGEATQNSESLTSETTAGIFATALR